MNWPFALRVNSTQPWMITSTWCYYFSSEDIDTRQLSVGRMAYTAAAAAGGTDHGLPDKAPTSVTE